MNTTRLYMNRALELARLGGLVKTNPRVGAVIVKQGTVIGEGYHHAFGTPHAEVEALKDCSRSPKGATMYVTLEPCNHVGKTPPCTDALLKAGIKEVLIGAKDPNPLVSGQGIKKLKANGVKVTIFGPDKDCRALNRPYFKWHEEKLPWVIMKMAQSLDAKIAFERGKELWLTSPTLVKESHRLRSRVDGIMVGINTILVDNAKLTVRAVRGKNPTRIILDPELSMPLTADVVTDQQSPTIIVTHERNISTKKATLLEKRGIQFIGFKKTLELKTLLNALLQRGLNRILIEGGPTTWTEFLQAKLVDEAYVYMTPYLLGQGVPTLHDLGVKTLKQSPQLHDLDVQQFENEVILHGYL